MKNTFNLKVVVFLFFIFCQISVQSQIVDLFVDPGHGGSDSGNMGAYIPNYTEKHVNLEIGLILKDFLDYNSNYFFQFSRLTNNSTFKPIERAYAAMEADPVAFISIHHNSTQEGVGPTQGTEVWWSSVPQSLDSPFTASDGTYWPGTYLGHFRDTDHTLALKLALKIKQVFGYPLRGISKIDTVKIAGINDDAKRDTIPGHWANNNLITVLCRTTMPSALTEASFLSDSTEEAKFYFNENLHRDREAYAIFYAFDSWMKGQGFAKVDYAYAGQAPTDSHDV